MRTRCCWTLIALALVWATPCSGTSARMLDPFEGIDEVSIHIMIGSHLRIEGGRWLFEGQRSRARRFEAELQRAIEAKLAECAIETTTAQSDAELHVRLYGGPIGEDQCSALSMFLVELDVLQHDSESGDDVRFGKGLLGAAKDDRLEAEIRKVVLYALDEAMQDCSERKSLEVSLVPGDG